MLTVTPGDDEDEDCGEPESVAVGDCEGGVEDTLGVGLSDVGVEGGAGLGAGVASVTNVSAASSIAAPRVELTEPFAISRSTALSSDATAALSCVKVPVAAIRRISSTFVLS